VPPGNYLIFADAHASTDDSSPQTTTCSLSSGAKTVVRPGNFGAPADETAVALVDAATFTTNATITMKCAGFRVNIEDVVLAAIAIGTIH
jgi:hypothetical protein